MSITAQYDGHCKRCKRLVRSGERVEWAPKQGIVCADCLAPTPQVAASVRFNREWIDLKNEYALQEAAQERRAYEREMEEELRAEGARYGRSR